MLFKRLTKSVECQVFQIDFIHFCYIKMIIISGDWYTILKIKVSSGKKKENEFSQNQTKLTLNVQDYK